jgi:NAD(P)-dependent dehydrogenase (short-subunit alcohol dehydrogenase family)
VTIKASWAGSRILVTGSSRGIGLATSHQLARLGASLALVGRTRSALEKVLADLPNGPHAAIALDVADEAKWDEAKERIAPDGFLHGIVTAAGELGPIGPIGTWNARAFRQTLDVNVGGTLLPIMVLLEPLRAARGAVVTFSGAGATGAFPRYDAYAASKVAVVRLTENLAAELKEQGVRVNCVAPGFVPTDIHTGTIQAGPELAGSDYFERTRRIIDGGRGDPPELAAALVAFLLSEESDGITGRLISARWDPWQEESFRARLRTDPDLATLRRIDDQFFTSVDHPKS